MTQSQRQAMQSHAKRLRESSPTNPNAIKDAAKRVQDSRATIELRAAS